jgi:hypothetical protein
VLFDSEDEDDLESELLELSDELELDELSLFSLFLVSDVSRARLRVP